MGSKTGAIPVTPSPVVFRFSGTVQECLGPLGQTDPGPRTDRVRRTGRHQRPRSPRPGRRPPPRDPGTGSGGLTTRSVDL